MNNLIKLNNGVEIPVVGLGVFRAVSGKETSDAVYWAIKAGYRHIDTAAAYGNEESVADGIARSGVDRKDIFITTKLWCSDIDNGTQIKAFETSLKKLGTDYVDLYLLHWPVEKQKNIDSWKALESLYKDGKIRAIGVSNYTERHLDELLEVATVCPAVNQVELHPDFSQQPLYDFCMEKGIYLEAWSPLGGQGSNLMQNETLVKLANKYGKTPAQIIIRWNIQRNVIVIPKSVHEDRIKSNFDVFDFALSDEDMEVIKNMNEDKRYAAHPDNFNYKRPPRKD